MIEKAKEQLRNYETSFGANYFMALFLVYLTAFIWMGKAQNLHGPLINLFILICSFLSIVSIHSLIEVAMARSKWAYRFAIFFVFLLYQILYLYHLKMGSHLDYSIIAINWNEVQNQESADLVKSQFEKKVKALDYFIIFSVSFILFYWGVFKDKLRPRQQEKKMIRAGVSLLAIILMLNAPLLMFDEISFVMQSAYRYHLPPEKPYDFAAEFEKNPYPYLKDFQGTGDPIKRPNLIIIAIESFNANFAMTKASNGKEYTPVFNSYVDKGIYIKNFYGHSMQTAKGHFSLLCGMPPLITKKALISSYQNNLNCLPKLLKEKGYETYFVQGFHLFDFDNTKNFMLSNGFNTFEFTDSSFLSEEDRAKYFWGFGIQDDFTYRQAFKTMDRLHKENPDKPLFTMIATISNHMDFSHLPPRLRKVYPDQKNEHEYYANSIHATDEFLKVFFTEFEKRDYLKDNTIIIITGDHSFPVGEHGQYLPEAGSYKEQFRTPFLMLWPGVLEPEVRDTYHSQHDVAPTLLDILGYQGKVNFTGRTFYSNKESTFPIPLIQPYDGKHLGGIIDGVKYMHQERTDKHTLFDLNRDPDELKNLQGNHPLTAQFQELIKMLYYNEYLILGNQVAPKDPTKVQ